MYNKLKNIVPHKIKIDNFFTLLLLFQKKIFIFAFRERKLPLIHIIFGEVRYIYLVNGNLLIF